MGKIKVIIFVLLFVAIFVDAIVENFICTDRVEASDLVPLTYTVQPGDTLWDIAATHRHGVRYWEYIQMVKDANNLRGNTIYPGQRIIIFD